MKYYERHNRYLSDKEKNEILDELDILYKAANPYHNNGLDIQMMPLLIELNKIDGVVTIQSCCGHAIGNYHDDASLWIRLSKEMSNKFYKNAFKLSRIKGFSRVYTLYSSWGEEIVELIFDSIEENDEITGRIIEFFKML